MVRMTAVRSFRRSQVMVLENEHGYVIVCGLDPWSRIMRLAPFDAVLAQYGSFGEVLCLPGIDRHKKCQIVRTLSRVLESTKPIVYPRRGFRRGRVGIIDKTGKLIADGNGWDDLSKQTGWDRRAIKAGHVGGEDYRGCPVILLETPPSET